MFFARRRAFSTQGRPDSTACTARLLLPAWELVPLFWLSAGNGVAVGALAFVAQRPAVALASFVGVGYLAYVLVEWVGLCSPWTLAAFGVAGGVALVLLIVRPNGEMLIINSVLASAGLIFTSLLAWFPYFQLWNGMSALIIAAIAVVVGLIHQFRELPRALLSSSALPKPTLPCRPPGQHPARNALPWESSI